MLIGSRNVCHIFSFFFAKAFDNATIGQLLETKLKGFITSPTEGKAFSKPISKFQAHFLMEKGVFFLFISDMADRPNVIAKEMKRAATLFHKNFPNPTDINTDSQEKQEFTTFIKETHYYLHPKLALLGPLESGKGM